MATFRNITGTSTIPAGVTQFGTVAATDYPLAVSRSIIPAWAVGAKSAGDLVVYEGLIYINLTGTNTADAPPDDKTNWAQYSIQLKQWLWLYLDDNGAGEQALAKITGIQQNYNETDDTYQILYFLDREISVTGSVAFQIVEGNLTTWGATNNGGAAGELGGVTIADGQTVNEQLKRQNWGNRYQDVVTVDGSGTNIYVVEN